MKLADREPLLGKDQFFQSTSFEIPIFVGFYESKFAKHGQFKI